jgi:hypothetical protein
MSRTISISTSVFAAIWASRQEGEESENAILSRVLGCNVEAAPSVQVNGDLEFEGGVRDTRNGVEFPEGFEIFRTYKRREYHATARNGFWVLSDSDKKFQTLNQLNASIAAGAENVWNGNWKFRSENGSIRSIGELRK